MFRLQGSVHFRLLPDTLPERLTVEELGDWRMLRLPGIMLRWHAQAAEMTTGERAIAVVTRAPSRGGGAGWFDRYLRDGIEAASEAFEKVSGVVIDVSRKRARLFVDRFAMEPMCYRHVGDGRLSFSDRADAVPDSMQRLDPRAIYDYLYFHTIPAPRTIYDDVRRVEAAQCVVADEGNAVPHVYWRPRFREADTHDLPERLKMFRELVRTSVTANAGDRVACFLSGGTDSSTVAGMLAQLDGAPVHAYSIGFEAKGYDEMAFARIAAKCFRLVHHEHYVTPADVVQAIPALAASFDQPFGNSSVVPAYYCALYAKNDGFERMLAGDGGDELFAGNSRYALQKAFAFYELLPEGVRKSILEPLALRSPLLRHAPLLKQIGGYVRHARHPMPDRLETFQLLDRLAHEGIFEAPFLGTVDTRSPLDQQRAHWAECEGPSLLNRMLEYDWKYTLADNDLPKVRFATQLAGIDVAYPLLSRALTDFSLTLPEAWKLKRFQLRWFYKEALRDFLPREILRKKKHGFGLPFGHWVLSHATLRALAADSLDGISRRGIVRRQFVERLLDVHLPQTPGYYGEMVWILTMLEQWFRAHATSPRMQPLDCPAMNLFSPIAG